MSMSAISRLRSIQLAPKKALRAALLLAADPDDLPQVFTIIEALSLDTMARIHDRMCASARGQGLLREQPKIVPLLADRAALARLPDGSLGRAYLEFVEREKISAEGIIAANAAGAERPLLPGIDFVHARLRDTHDLWHAAVGYHGDVLGETALLAFSLAQMRNPALALIIGIGILKMARHPGVLRTIVDGFGRGWRAAWLPEQRWEELLALPLGEVRQRLRLPAPPVYEPLRSSLFKGRAAVASQAA
jgi:ubiquinone biosynthesis protein COQ4